MADWIVTALRCIWAITSSVICLQNSKTNARKGRLQPQALRRLPARQQALLALGVTTVLRALVMITVTVAIAIEGTTGELHATSECFRALLPCSWLNWFLAVTGEGTASAHGALADGGCKAMCITTYSSHV